MLLKQLSIPEKAEYREVLRAGYLQRIQVDLLDTNENVTASLSEGPIAVMGGEVQMDMSSTVSRTCRLELVDDSHKLRWGKRDDHEYVMYVGRMVQVVWGCWLPKAGVWADVPVFTGPVTGFSSQGANVSIDAAGKEWLLLAPFMNMRSPMWGAGAHPTQVIRQVLADRGENHFRGFPPNPKQTLGSRWGLTRWSEPWPNCRRLAFLAQHKVLYYAGDGYATLRGQSSKSAWDFGRGLDVLGDPRFTYQFAELRNFVEVQYTKGKKGKNYTEVADLGPPHPLAAAVLKRHGEPLWMSEQVQASAANLSSTSAKLLAITQLNQKSKTPVQVQFEALPVPHLEEYTTASITWAGIKTTFALRSFSLGLTPGGTMSINIESDQVRKRTKV